LKQSRKDEPFWDFGHTPASSIEAIGTEAINQAFTSRFLVESKSELKPDTPIALINPEYPYTLDLRHYWKAKTK
jgi:hypothetical protein